MGTNRISGAQCLAAKQTKKLVYHFRVHESAYQWYERSTAFTLNQTNITSQSDFLLLYTRDTHNVSRAKV